MKTHLEIEPEFEQMTIPCDAFEMERLEQSILEKGCVKPIVVWNGIILDGHKRYQICSYEEIDFEIEEMTFHSKEEALIWICRQRIPFLNNRNMSYRYLVGKWYRCGILFHREHKKDYAETRTREKERKNANEAYLYRTSKRIADELGLFHTTIEKDGNIAIAMDEIAKKDHRLFKILMGDNCRYTCQKVTEMAQWSVKRLREERRKNKLETERQNTRMRNTLNDPEQYEQKRMEAKPEVPLVVGIKEMPKFDPDMELRGLALTIPTWMNAMQRAQSKTDMSLVSEEMKAQLAKTLQRFLVQINQTMEGLNL